MNTLYTVRRVRANGNLFGSSHGSMDADKTTCGKDIDMKWWITNTKFDGEITCSECLKILREEEKNEP